MARHADIGDPPIAVSLVVLFSSAPRILRSLVGRMLEEYKRELELLLSSGLRLSEPKAVREHVQAARALCLLSSNLRVEMARSRPGKDSLDWLAHLFEVTAGGIERSVDEDAKMFASHLEERARNLRGEDREWSLRLGAEPSSVFLR